nr:MAG TPA: hypothetical protein [Caudoviricetes sp.]
MVLAFLIYIQIAFSVKINYNNLVILNVESEVKDNICI